MNTSSGDVPRHMEWKLETLIVFDILIYIHFWQGKSTANVSSSDDKKNE
jgi:hypothetical protein